MTAHKRCSNIGGPTDFGKCLCMKNACAKVFLHKPILDKWLREPPKWLREPPRVRVTFQNACAKVFLHKPILDKWVREPPKWLREPPRVRVTFQNACAKVFLHKLILDKWLREPPRARITFLQKFSKIGSLLDLQGKKTMEPAFEKYLRSGGRPA